MAASNIENRKVDVVVRAAHGLKPPSGLLSSLPSIGGQPTPYLEVELSGSPTMKTDVNVQDAVNPVFDQKLVLDIIPATPDEAALMLHVRAYYKSAMAPITTALPLVPDEIVPDTLIGSGSAPLSQLFAVGHEDARVALTSPADGSPAGVAYIGVRMATPLEDQPIPSAAGTVLGQVHRPPEGPVAKETASGPMMVPTAQMTPTTPSPAIGAALPGGIEDPSSAAYGILKE